jgi:hypothetical protein
VLRARRGGLSCPRDAGADVSDKLNGIVKNATNLSLEQRYESVVWVRTELEALVKSGDVGKRVA